MPLNGNVEQLSQSCLSKHSPCGYACFSAFFAVGFRWVGTWRAGNVGVAAFPTHTETFKTAHNFKYNALRTLERR